MLRIASTLKMHHRAMLSRLQIFIIGSCCSVSFPWGKALQRICGSKIITLINRKAVHGGQIERPIDLVRTRLISSLNPDDEDIDPSIEELKFPWMIQSRSPMVYQVLCGYKDYSSAVSLRQLITARILEGFFLRAFHVSRREGRRSKVQITLALPWIPNVTVLYTIRTSWGDMETPLMEDSIGHKHRIELNVLAYRQFVMLFINMQQYEKTDLMYENTLHDKVVVLHSYLNRTVETDGI
jgi:hypothetical protein